MWASAPPACLWLCVCEMSWVNQGSPSFIELRNSFLSKAGWGRHQEVLLLFFFFLRILSFLFPLLENLSETTDGCVLFCFVFSFDSKRFKVARAMGYKSMEVMSAGFSWRTFSSNTPPSQAYPIRTSGSEESCLLGSSFPLGARFKRHDPRGSGAFTPAAPLRQVAQSLHAPLLRCSQFRSSDFPSASMFFLLLFYFD